MALLLQRRARIKTNIFTNPSLIHLFSTSNSNDDEPDSATTDDHASTNSTSSFSSYFSDVKNVLRQRQPTSPSSTPGKPLTSSFPASGSLPQRPSQLSSFEEIRKNLHEFRRRSSDPNSTPSSSPNQISFQELYKRNVIGKPGESAPNADVGPGKVGSRFSVDAIRESLKKIRPSGSAQSDRESVDPMSSSALKHSFKLKPSDSTGSGTSSTVIGGTGTLPASVFGKEMREKKERARSGEMKTEFVKLYKHEELGNKLRMLRPEAKGGDWFSLEELNQRLMKLREMDEKVTESDIKVVVFKDLRDSLIKLKTSQETKNESSLQRLDILGELGRTPSFMLQPPKEHLVEKYFHEDNMSSAEKLKIKIAEVRDEFKMSESDCGSARVQVAQLTTKIEHLSKVLHKKDKHSRKGLIAMVQRRKRLLKYLRRTDWDSYCFVISKLDLRDNPDHIYKNRTKKSDDQTDKRAGRKGKKASRKGKRAGQTSKHVNHPIGLVS